MSNPFELMKNAGPPPGGWVNADGSAFTSAQAAAYMAAAPGGVTPVSRERRLPVWAWVGLGVIVFVVMAISLAHLLENERVTAPNHIVQDWAFCDADRCNLREGPGPEYPVVGAVRRHETLPMTGSDNGERWVEIRWNGQTAYVSRRIVKF